MPNKCSVLGCKGNSNHGNSVSVFRFPAEKDLRAEWIHRCKRQNFEPSKSSRVCEKHFRKEDILLEAEFFDQKSGRTLKSPLPNPRLKKGAVPEFLPSSRSLLLPQTAGESPERKRQKQEVLKVENADSNKAQAENTKQLVTWNLILSPKAPTSEDQKKELATARLDPTSPIYPPVSKLKKKDLLTTKSGEKVVKTRTPKVAKTPMTNLTVSQRAIKQLETTYAKSQSYIRLPDTFSAAKSQLNDMSPPLVFATKSPPAVFASKSQPNVPSPFSMFAGKRKKTLFTRTKTKGKKKEEIQEHKRFINREIQEHRRFINRVENMSAERLQKKRTANRTENMSAERLQKKRTANRRENMSAERLQKKRTANRRENMSAERLQKKRTANRTENMSAERLQKKRTANRRENMSAERLQKKRTANRTENMSAERLQKKRTANRRENMSAERLQKKRTADRRENMSAERLQKKRTADRLRVEKIRAATKDKKASKQLVTWNLFLSPKAPTSEDQSKELATARLDPTSPIYPPVSKLKKKDLLTTKSGAGEKVVKTRTPKVDKTPTTNLTVSQRAIKQLETTYAKSQSYIRLPDTLSAAKSQLNDMSPPLVFATKSPPAVFASKYTKANVPSPASVFATQSQPNVPSPAALFATKSQPDMLSPCMYVTKSQPDAPYAFNGRRLVRMGYFIKSLQQLNDHPGYSCNFSNMEVYGEVVSTGWNVGIVYKCQSCPTSKVVWMEDPDALSPPPTPIIQPKNDIAQPLSVYKLHKSTSQVNSVPPTHNGAPDQEFIPPPVPEDYLLLDMMQTQGNATLPHYGPPQVPTTFRPPPRHEVPEINKCTTAHTPILDQSQNSILGDLLQDHCVYQSESNTIGQTNSLHNNLEIDQSQSSHVVGQSIDFMKQETILPDDEQSGLQSAPDIVKVELSFCVEDQPGADNDSTSASMDVTESLSSNPPGDNSSSQSTSDGAIFASNERAKGTSVMPTIGDILPVDLNLVKKEIDDDDIT